MAGLHADGARIDCLVYRSASRVSLVEAGQTVLQDILEVSRIRNSQLGITGVLYYEASRFTQLLEGPHSAVAEIFASISRDERHYDVVVVSHSCSRRRAFPNWSMAMMNETDYQTALQRLHPGLAVPGIPKEPVSAFIAALRASLALADAG
jgi:hypothetical protein